MNLKTQEAKDRLTYYMRGRLPDRIEAIPDIIAEASFNIASIVAFFALCILFANWKGGSKS